MVRTITKLSLILLFIVALPMGFYLTRELSTLNENEQMVERVFSTQLESILLSVNQYSESLISRWGQSLDQPVPLDGSLMAGIVKNLMQNNPSVEAIRFTRVGLANDLAIYIKEGIENPVFEMPPVSKIRSLKDFLTNNYQKIESAVLSDQVELYFMLRNTEDDVICQVLINPVDFVAQNLGPQIQQISQDLFYIEVRDTVNNKLIYSIEEIEEPPHSIQTLSLWYLPEYKAGIRLKAKTLQELATERSKMSSLFLWGLSVVVILGLSFVIWNIRKEMKLAELKSEFVSNVSHEIRTPLSLISMYAETLILKRVKTEEKQTAYLETIYKESNRLTEIVNRVLDFSIIEKNKRAYEFELLDMNKLIPQVIQSYNTNFEARGVDCLFLPAQKKAWIMADRETVIDMLMNLVDNAIKYGKESGKRIEFRLSERKNQLWLEVEDNGIGISVRDQKYIFDQFFRVTDRNLALKAKGSGLGLNLVKKMMKAHGGSVAVKSKLGEGSTFILKFPIKKRYHV